MTVWNEKTQRELGGLALMLLAVATLLSLIPISGDTAFSTGNIMGVVGAGFASLARRAFGIGAFGLPVLPALWAAAAFDWLEKDRAFRLSILTFGLSVLIPATMVVSQPDATAAAWVGSAIAVPLLALLGGVGSWLVLFFLYAGLLVLTLGWNPLTAAIRG